MAKYKILEKLADRYPKTVKPKLAKDKKTGKEFLQKQTSSEAKELKKARDAVAKQINAGEYDPFFPLEERYYADPTKYDLGGRTSIDAMPKKQETIDKYRSLIDTPETRSKLDEAYARSANDPLAKDWYALGQLEKEFIDYYGEDLGRRLFKERFADAMAATTGGADPTSNLLMAQLGNYYRANNIPQPTAGYDFPFPVGGRFITGNMGMYDRVINQGQGLLASQQPKRFNFSSNFLGNRDRPTIDEQMMTLFPGDAKAPPGSSYGVYEQVVNEAAKRAGVEPVNFQDVAWAGAKGVQGKPMIQHVNEAIERTSKVTGKSPKDVVVDSLVKGKSPLYSVAPTAGILANEYQGDPMTGMDLSQARGDSRPFFPTMAEYGKSAIRGIPLGILDTLSSLAELGKSMKFKGMENVDSDRMMKRNKEYIPDYKAKYLDKDEKELAEFIGGLLGPI